MIFFEIEEKTRFKHKYTIYYTFMIELFFKYKLKKKEKCIIIYLSNK